MIFFGDIKPVGWLKKEWKITCKVISVIWIK